MNRRKFIKKDNWPDPKLTVGDTAFYMADGKLNIVTIERIDPVFNGSYELKHGEEKFLTYSYAILGYKAMAFMDGLYAPVSISVKEDKLFATADEVAAYANCVQLTCDELILKGKNDS